MVGREVLTNKPKPKFLQNVKPQCRFVSNFSRMYSFSLQLQWLVMDHLLEGTEKSALASEGFFFQCIISDLVKTGELSQYVGK